MPDWKNIVQKRVAPLRLHGAAETELVEELAQDLEDRYQEYCAAGSAEEAYQKVVSELDDMDVLAREVEKSRRLVIRDSVPFGEERRGNF